MGYRPICDMWIMARPKVKYYGAYPNGFLGRARALLGVSIDDSVLHVCSGMVKDYPCQGFGPNDKTLDLDGNLKPDFNQDCMESLPDMCGQGWPAILADPPYTFEDGEHYKPGGICVPKPTALLRHCLGAVRTGGRVGMLHYEFPRPPKWAKLVACVGVLMGYCNRVRLYSVFERVTGTILG